MEPIFNTYINVRVIENGYLVVASVADQNGRYREETWYAISPDEVKHKLDKYL